MAMPAIYEYTGTPTLSMVDADGVARVHTPSDYQLVEIDPITKGQIFGSTLTAGHGSTWQDFTLDGSWVLV